MNISSQLKDVKQSMFEKKNRKLIAPMKKKLGKVETRAMKIVNAYANAHYKHIAKLSMHIKLFMHMPTHTKNTLCKQ